MASANEEAVKKALHIESWQHLSKDKVLDFIEIMPTLDKDIALGIIAQLPNFKDLALGALSSLEKQFKSALDADHDSQKRVHQAFREYRAMLKQELRRDDLTLAERLQILELIRQAAERDYDKDSEHKAFVLKLVGVSGSVALVLAAGALAVATGGRIKLKAG